MNIKKPNSIAPPQSHLTSLGKSKKYVRILAVLAIVALAAVESQGAVPSLEVTNNLKLWLKADAGITTNTSGNITAWSDQSGSGNHASTTDPTQAPKLVNGVLNGNPVLRFDGVNNYFDVADAPSLQITGDIASFAVVKFDDYANWRAVWGKTANNLPAPTDYYLVQGTGVPRVYRGDGTSSNLGNVDANRAVTPGLYLVLGFDMAGTTLTHYINGYPVGSGEITATLGDGGMALKVGSRDDLVTKMKGDMAELLIYDAALSETDRNKVFDYLKNKYGLQNLPPTVSVTKPANNANLTAGTTNTITVDASDSDGRVAKVDFYANGLLLATATDKPYSVPVILKSGGPLTLWAVATDDKDATTKSAEIKVTIAGGSGLAYAASPSLKLWLKADAGVTTNASGQVTGWADQTSNKNDAAQTTDTAMPQYVANAVNSLPVIRFDGTSRYLDVASNPGLAITGDIASFFVLKFDDFATYRAVWAKTSSNMPRPTDYYALPGNGVGRYYRGGDGDTGGNGYVDTAAALPVAQYFFAGFSQASNQVTHWLNGNAFGTGTIGLTPTDAGTALRIGSRDDLVTQLKGDLAEVLIFDAAITGSDRDNISAYLAAKYAIPWLQSANQAPVASLTNLTEGATMGIPAKVLLAASATDTDGSVSKVDFYANGLMLSSSSTAPYQLPVQIKSPGRVSFTVVATDNLGISATSAPVSIMATGAVPSMTVTSGLQVWLKADAGVTASATGAVTAWKDQSGKGNNASQMDETQAPALVLDGMNGEPTLRFEGAPKFLELDLSPGLAITGDITSFSVVRCDDYSNWRGIWGQTVGGIPAPNDYYLASGTGIPTFNRGDGTAVGGVAGKLAVPAGANVVLGFEAAGTNVTHYLNDTINGTGTITATISDGGTALRLGSRNDLVTQMKGDIAELLIYNRALSESDRTTVINYLAAKYGIAMVSATSPSLTPTLTGVRQTNGSILISWPQEIIGFVLEATPDLAKPAWTAVSGVQNNQITVTPTAGNQFYRLRQP